jgi:hypothetical protein
VGRDELAGGVATCSVLIFTDPDLGVFGEVLSGVWRFFNACNLWFICARAVLGGNLGESSFIGGGASPDSAKKLCLA